MKNQTDFATGSVYRNILDVAIPLTVAQFLNLMYNIVDRIFIGRIPEAGTLAFAGVGICFPIITFISAFALLFGSGGAPLCGIRRGQGDHEEAERIMGNTFSMLLIIGVILSIGGFLFLEPILCAFGASEHTFRYAYDYMFCYLFGTLFVMIAVGLNPFISSQGFGRTGMMTIVIGTLTNIVLDPLFIFGLDMGTRGAALATVISQALSALWILRFLTGKQSILKLRYSAMRLQWARLRSIISLGLSSFVGWMTNSLVQIMLNTSALTFGGDIYISVVTVLNSVRDIFAMPLMSLTSAAAQVMSFNYGERTFWRVRKSIWFSTALSLGYAVLVWVLVMLCPEVFVRIFNNDPALISLTVPAIRIYFGAFFVMGLPYVGQNTFVALGKGKYAIFFSILRKGVIIIPLLFILPRLWGLGIDGIFYAEPVSNVIGALLCYLTMLKVVMPELKDHTVA